MGIAQYYSDHGKVRDADRGFVFNINGEILVDYNALDRAYRDKFWQNFKRYYNKLEQSITQ